MQQKEEKIAGHTAKHIAGHTAEHTTERNAEYNDKYNQFAGKCCTFSRRYFPGVRILKSNHEDWIRSSRLRVWQHT